MPTQTHDYHTLEKDIMTYMRDAALRGEIQADDIYAITTILSACSDYDTLTYLASVLAQSDYPFLKHALSISKESEQTVLRDELDDVVARVIKSDPLLATKVARYVQEHGHSLADVLHEFPTVKAYLGK